MSHQIRSASLTLFHSIMMRIGSWTVATHGFVLCASVFSQSSVTTIIGGEGQALGETTTVIGDLDNDGVAEVVLSSTHFRPFGAGGVIAGRVQVISGASLSTGTAVILHDITGPTSMAGCGGASGSNFGKSVAGNKDIDGDGVTDFVVGAPTSGRVIPYSGATGLPLLPAGFDLDGACAGRHGESIELINADGDAYADVLVAYTSESFITPAHFTVYRGAWIRDPLGGGARKLYTRLSTGVLDRMGACSAVLGDIDGDGREDFALGAPVSGHLNYPNGSIVVVSGAAGTLIKRFGPSPGGGFIGREVAALPDRDADGLPELAVTEQRWPSQSNSLGRVEIVSGGWLASGGAGQRTIDYVTLPDSAGTTEFGFTLATSDVNADGHADLLVGYNGTTVIEWATFSGRTNERMWTKRTSQVNSQGLRPSCSILGQGRGGLAILGLPEVPVNNTTRSGIMVAVRLHDGAGFQAAAGINCPCGVDQPHAGCMNSTGNGASLAVEAGTLSLSGHGLTATTTGLPPFAFGMLVGGVPAQSSPLANGLLGISQFIRGRPQQSDSRGMIMTSGDVLGGFAAASAVTPGTLAPMVGVPFALQMYYRDMSCTGGANLSNSYIVVPR